MAADYCPIGQHGFYAQAGIVILSLAAGWVLSALTVPRMRIFREKSQPSKQYDVRQNLYRLHELSTLVTIAIVLGILTPITAGSPR